MVISLVTCLVALTWCFAQDAMIGVGDKERLYRWFSELGRPFMFSASGVVPVGGGHSGKIEFLGVLQLNVCAKCFIERERYRLGVSLLISSVALN
jgi:hypothetical protein